MATPIKPTPVLKGKSSKRFHQDVEKNLSNKLSKEEREKILQNVKKILSKQQGSC